MKNNPIKPHCGHHVPHTPPVRLGEINYTSEQINALLGMIPFKADRAEVPKMEKLSDVNYVGHVVDPSLLVYQSQPSWALVGSLKRAKPYFYYVEGYVPKGYTAGWNDISPVLGTYDLTTDKVSIFDFNLVTEYNVSRNHPNIKRDFSNDWGMAKFYYPEYDEYQPYKVYQKGDYVNMPEYTEYTFIALHETSDAPFVVTSSTNEFTLEEALDIVPDEYRFPGIKITFANSETKKAETYYWLGGDWYSTDRWIVPKGDNGLPPRLSVIGNKLHYSYDNENWVVCSDFIAHYFRIKDNKLQISPDNVNWENLSDYIAAYFRFKSTFDESNGATIGNIQISRDNKNWQDLSPEFINHLRISKYVATTSELPSSVPVGSIYGVGPIFREEDTGHTNPYYRLYAFDGEKWVDNGEFTSIAAGIVQETGDSETEVMSQKAVTEGMSELGASILVFDKGYYLSTTGSLVSYNKSRITLIHKPTTNCKFHGLWNNPSSSSSGYGVSYLDDDFNFLGGATDCVEGQEVNYTFTASTTIPTGTKYLLLHTQSDNFRIETTERLLYISYLNAKKTKENSNNIEAITGKSYNNPFVAHPQIAPYIKELYISGNVEGRIFRFSQFFNNNYSDTPTDTKGFNIYDNNGTLIYYTDAAKDGYNKFTSYDRDIIIEMIADFTSVPHGWNGLSSDYPKDILSPAYNAMYSPSIKEKHDMETVNSDLSVITNDLKDKIDGSKTTGKNMFNKDTVIDGYYIGTSNGLLLKESTSAISALMPVQEGEMYRVSRPYETWPGVTEVRFVAEDKETPLLPLKADGTPYGNYQTSSNCTLKAPIGAKYMQITVKFVGKPFDYDKIQVEKGTATTSYEPYYEKVIVDYPNLPEGLDNIAERVENLEGGSGGSGAVEKITIQNSDKIGFFSNSFLNGYCMLGKHAINNLSMFSDYIMYNYGHSGDDLLELLNRVNSNEAWLGDVAVQNWGIKYGIIAMQDNDIALFSAASDTYYENAKKLANSIKAMGGIPILGTEHDNSPYYYNFSRLAQEYGIMFMNWGRIAGKLYNKVFPPFWYNSHPATRTAWMWSYGMKPYIDSLPRPSKSIKLFRARPDVDTTDLDNLMYDDVVSRAKTFEEITCGVSGLSEATEKYFDRIDSGNTVYSNYKDEYQKLQQKSSSVNFGAHALVEVVAPYDRKSLKTIKAKITGTGISEVYVKKINSLSNPLPISKNIAFGLESGTMSVGQSFQVTGGVFNDNIIDTYTVGAIVNGIVITTTQSSGKTVSGTDNPTTNIEGVTLKGSYSYPSSDYMNRYNKPLGEWVKVAGTDNIDLSQYIETCMDYDKMSILVVGNSIAMSDIEFEVSGGTKKESESKNVVVAKNGKSLLTKTTFDDNDVEWVGLGNIEKYSPVKANATDQYESLPVNVTTARQMRAGQSIKQKIVTDNIEFMDYASSNIQIRVVSRYFPEYVNDDTKWSTSKIKRGSYDCANLVVKIATSEADTNPVKVAVIPVGLWWNEFIINTTYYSGSYIVLESESDDVQIARCEVVQINN